MDGAVTLCIRDLKMVDLSPLVATMRDLAIPDHVGERALNLIERALLAEAIAERMQRVG